jgi:hypothetical protein
METAKTTSTNLRAEPTEGREPFNWEKYKTGMYAAETHDGHKCHPQILYIEAPTHPTGEYARAYQVAVLPSPLEQMMGRRAETESYFVSHPDPEVAASLELPENQLYMVKQVLQ